MSITSTAVSVALLALLILTGAGCKRGTKSWNCVMDSNTSVTNGMKSYHYEYLCDGRRIVIKGDRKGWNAMDKNVLKIPYTSTGSIDGKESCTFSVIDSQAGTKKPWDPEVASQDAIKAANASCSWALPQE